MGVSRASLIAATLLLGVWAHPLPAFGA